MAKHKETKASAKDCGYKATKSTSKDSYANSVANNVKTQKKQSEYNCDRRDGPGGN